MDEDDTTASYGCHVYEAEAFRVVGGANLGDHLLGPDEIEPGDVYRLCPGATLRELSVAGAGGRAVMGRREGVHRVAEGSGIGRAGQPLRAVARATFLGPQGHKADVLLIEIGGQRRALYAALPIDPLEPGFDHTLVSVDPDPGDVRLADVTSVAFARGTEITMADGRQMPVERLSAGDRILTRDHGPQPIRHILHRTVRAAGPHAPVVIARDTLGNAADLIVSQHQRLFIYQRGQDRVTPTAEMLVRAGYLADGERIFVRPGNFVDYFTLILDRHEIIYAECIPAESLEVSPATLATLAEDVAREVGERLPEVAHDPHFGTEADPARAAAAMERMIHRRRG
ncbi:Hint domain-containing protein [Roseicyclus sp. F158]|uniref:Hint domain-containing protein n=1 Tax=Tropicimonas omnivorans TaxID=3075590 RepID=A0ABU3DG61_9RHOB|nr:Hint domain-containing protein [Roseicyclus sp. F158]MDT0682703.1 Hint domain-containing protein [Roseicyclus sp. F158]